MNDNSNVFIAIALSIAILIGWQYLVADPSLENIQHSKNAEEVIRQEQSGEIASVPALPENAQTPNLQNAPQTPTASNIVKPRNELISSSGRVSFENELIKGSVRLEGGRIDDLILKNYTETVDQDSAKIELLSPSKTQDPWYVDFGWLDQAQGSDVPTAQTVWTQASSGSLSPSNPLILEWDNGNGLLFKRTYTIDDAYLFNVTNEVVNNSAEQRIFYPYSLISRHGRPETEDFFILHEGMIGVLGENGLTEVDYDELHEERDGLVYNNADGWLGITDKYWAVTLMPDAQDKFRGKFKAFPAGYDWNYQVEYLGGSLAVEANSSIQNSMRIFAGAKVSSLIDNYAEEQNIRQYDLLIDWGMLYFFTKPLFQLLIWLNGFIGNFGFAILAATVLIKLVFFPLANKSYKAMGMMKKLQPEMQRIRELHKDDRMKQQQAVMELYKKEKLNPAAGCWPVLIQIPVFFALYKVLFVTIEMRHAPFFGWIQDLAAPDPTSLFNLFGLLNFDAPSFLIVGVWPILMGISMFIQMRLNPPPPDRTQQIIFDLMPLFFTFFLASFPAGLIIYWTWNNVLSILQQWIIMSRQGVKIELWKNIKRSFVSKKQDDK